jgi:hypothetical protein
MLKEGIINTFFELLSNSIKFLRKTEVYYPSYNHGIIDLIKIESKMNDNLVFYSYLIHDHFSFLLKFI